MVTNLLDLSRLEGGAITPVLEAHPADELVDVALRAARSALDGAPVRVRVPSPAPIVRADTVLTERILVNLLHNAARHGGPPIEMDVESAGRTIRLTVTDGGPGVDPGVVDELFEPFVRGRDGAGAGLGLALARGLAEAQGGEVNLARSGPGTSFELLLPAGDE
jgi:two-component system sensor histidine kinase KdpD